MSMPDVADFLFDHENEEEMAVHGLTPRRVIQVLENNHIVVPNRRRRRARYLIVGRDNGGASITVPIQATGDPLSGGRSPRGRLRTTSASAWRGPNRPVTA